MYYDSSEKGYRLGRPVDLPRGVPGTRNCGKEYRARSVLQEVVTVPQM